MHTKIRTIALAAALTALTPAAFAEAVTLGFDDFSGATESSAVGTVQGLVFQGAYGYNAALLDTLYAQDSGYPDNLARVSEARGGFVLNKQLGKESTDITISLEQNPAARSTSSVFFSSIAFSIWTNGSTPIGGSNPNKLTAIGDNGVEIVYPLNDGGLDVWILGSSPINFNPLDHITSLRFTAGSGASFALDDLLVTLSDSTGPGNNAPEPASFGLVGLALLGAGAASRRKQRG